MPGRICRPRGKSGRTPAQQTANDAGDEEVIQFGFKIANCRRSRLKKEAEAEGAWHVKATGP